jgi:type IV pilus assembly protein PilV
MNAPRTMGRNMARLSTRKLQEGVMLLEALVAILIFTLGIIALMGLQAASISQVTQNKYRTDASYLANKIIAKMWVDQANLASYATGNAEVTAWKADIARTLPAGNATITIPAAATGEATVQVTWKSPDDVVVRKFVTVATIMPRQ